MRYQLIHVDLDLDFRKCRFKLYIFMRTPEWVYRQAYIGVLLANNAAEIATTDPVPADVDASPATQAPCVGKWDSGAAVACDSSGK